MASRTAATHERDRFDARLSQIFPNGALCVEFVADAGRLRPTGVEVRAGRVTCRSARVRQSGGWEHRLQFDELRNVDGASAVDAVWIRDLRAVAAGDDLWEAALARGDREAVMRLKPM